MSNDNERTALMIGGVCDGQRRVVDGPSAVGQVIEQDCCFAIRSADEPVTFKRSHYRLEVVRSGALRFYLYIENSLSHDQALARIIASYPRAA